MVDIVPPETRSQMMSGIRAKNTKPELLVRKHLHAAGFRYRIHDTRLKGRPDLVFPKWNAVVFINGCFWHAHDCHLFKFPKTRPDFWKSKLVGNAERDRRNKHYLQSSGWRIGVVWECALKGSQRLSMREITQKIAEWLQSSRNDFELKGFS